MLAAMLLLAQGTEPGLTMRLYDVGVPLDELTPLVAGQTPNIDKRIERIDIQEGEFGLKDNFIAELSGEFYVSTGGSIQFRLSSDDGSVLSLDGKDVLWNDGVHPVVAKEATVTLKPGWRKIGIRFFEAVGGEALKLEYKLPGGEYKVADASVLRCPAGLTRVTSPGIKKVKGVGGARRPGNGMPLEKLHPGWDLIKIRPDEFQPQVGAMAFLPDGSLLVGTFKPNQSGEFLPNLTDGKIYRLTGVTGDNPIPEVKLAVDGIQEPLGMTVVNGRVYVATRTEISELFDRNGDGVFERSETVAKAWLSDNYHHFTFGLVHHEGFLYAALSTSITGDAPGINGPNPMYRGSVMKVDLSTPYDPKNPMRNCEFITGGHRTPNGVSLGPDGTILVGENQGSWQPSNKLNVIRVGGFYGHRNSVTFKNAQYPDGGVPGIFDRPLVDEPGLYLPQNEVSNSPGQTVLIPDGPYKGQLLIADVKYGGLRRAWMENYRGQWEGGAVAYSQGFEVGTNQMAWGPDGCLYIGGTGATETWAWTDPKTGKWTTFGLQKIKPNGRTAYEIVKATPYEGGGGFEVKFSRPTKTFKPAQIGVQQYNYKPTVEYGGDKQNRVTLGVTAVQRVSADTFRLKIPGLKAPRVTYLNLDVRSERNEPLWGQEVWYTLNQTHDKPMIKRRSLRLLVFSKTAGFRHESIAAGVTAIKKMAETSRFMEVQHTEDASVMTTDNLAKLDVVIFLNTTGDVLNDVQQGAFEKFIEGGGGFVGIHAAADTEYDWPFYGKLVGGYFHSHPPGTVEATIHSEKDELQLPKPWRHVDEWYNYRANPRPHVEVLARLDESTYQGGNMSDHPIMWRTRVGKGRGWYTGLGHTDSAFREAIFMDQLYKGIIWTAQQ